LALYLRQALISGTFHSSLSLLVYPKPTKDYMRFLVKKVAGLYQKIPMQKAIVQTEMA
jgi:hypothetical protein